MDAGQVTGAGSRVIAAGIAQSIPVVVLQAGEDEYLILEWFQRLKGLGKYEALTRRREASSLP